MNKYIYIYKYYHQNNIKYLCNFFSLFFFPVDVDKQKIEQQQQQNIISEKLFNIERCFA